MGFGDMMNEQQHKVNTYKRILRKMAKYDDRELNWHEIQEYSAIKRNHDVLAKAFTLAKQNEIKAQLGLLNIKGE